MIKIDEYPKSKQLLAEFSKRNLLAFQKNITKDVEAEIPEITDDMAAKYAEALITANISVLYGFFDEQGIYLTLKYWADGLFLPCVNDVCNDKERASSRQEVENDLFKYAFQLLEEKI